MEVVAVRKVETLSRFEVWADEILMTLISARPKIQLPIVSRDQRYRLSEFLVREIGDSFIFSSQWTAARHYQPDSGAP